MGILLIVSLFFQIRAKKYVPWLYWVAVVFISVFGTLITDNLTDSLGVPLQISTTVFSLLLAVTFVVWHKNERTLSIHSITTTKRELFYWLAILFTFALGTSAGDLMAESLNLGYALSAVIFASLIAFAAIAYYRFKANAIATFWIAYILTRPFGASCGDFLSQSTASGWLWFGTTATSVIFLCVILALVVYLTMAERKYMNVSE